MTTCIISPLYIQLQIHTFSIYFDIYIHYKITLHLFFFFVVVGWFQFLSVSFNLIGVCKLTTRLRWLRKHFCFKIRYSDIEFIHTYQKNIVLYTFTYTLTYSTYIYTHTNIVGVFVYILFVFSLINLCYLFRFFIELRFIPLASKGSQVYFVAGGAFSPPFYCCLS